MRGSWRTTVAGWALAIGVALAAVSEPAWIHNVGVILSSISALLLGTTARDNAVSSEEAGIK